MTFRRTIIAIPILAAIILICVVVEPVRTTLEQLFLLFGRADLDAIKEYILSFGMLAPIVSFLLMIFQSLIAPLPAFLITFANAALFGWFNGALISWSSAMVGAILCFILARLLGRDFTEKMTSKLALESVDKFFQDYGKHTILIARLLPFVSFDIVSYAAGLTSISFWTFVWATALGQLPATLIYSYAGGMLTGGAKTFVFGLLILFAFSILVMLLKQIWSKRQKIKKNLKAEVQ